MLYDDHHMKASGIHPTACVCSSAQLHPSVVVGPFAVVEANVQIDEGCHIGPHAVVHAHAHLHARIRVGAHAILGGAPQVRGFDQAVVSFTVIGENTFIHEGVTIHRPSVAGASTTIGPHCLLMAYSHVAHDCQLGEYVTLTNNVMVGGFVQIDRFANIGGGVGIHQNVKIGAYTMVGAMSSIMYDMPPYTLAAQRNTLHGLNLVGLKRNRFTAEQIKDIKRVYQAVYNQPGDPIKAAQLALDQQIAQTQQGLDFLKFFLETVRGCVLRPTSWRA